MNKDKKENYIGHDWCLDICVSHCRINNSNLI